MLSGYKLLHTNDREMFLEVAIKFASTKLFDVDYYTNNMLNELNVLKPKKDQTTDYIWGLFFNFLSNNLGGVYQLQIVQSGTLKTILFQL